MPLPIRPGTVDFLALGALSRGGRMHGFEILSWIEQHSEGAFVLEEGALYPSLHRMEKKGWLDSTWAVSEKGRRAKYYTITRAGRRALLDESASWSAYVSAVGKVTSGEAT